MTVCDILGPGRLQENCYIVLKKYLGIDYGPSGSETPVFGLLFNIMIVMAFIFLGLKNRPKWSKRDFMVRAKLDELDEELKLKDKKKETDAMFKEHMFYKQLLKEAKFRLKTSKVDHDTLVTKTQEEKLGFESLQRGLSTLDDQFKRYHHQQLRAMQELLDPAIDADEKEETEEF